MNELLVFAVCALSVALLVCLAIIVGRSPWPDNQRDERLLSAVRSEQAAYDLQGAYRRLLVAVLQIAEPKAAIQAMKGANLGEQAWVLQSFENDVYEMHGKRALEVDQ